MEIITLTGENQFSFFIHQECVCYLNVPSLHSPLFGLNLNLSFSNLISSGVNFFDNLRKKTPSTPSHSSATDSSPRYDYPDDLLVLVLLFDVT